jgi:DNA-binding GntR family transcriptional regulator
VVCLIKVGESAVRRVPSRREETGAERFDRIHTELRDRICLLDYPPGTILSEVALAKEFGVSRTPIRRVLHKLEFMGLVQIKNGVGTIVTDINLKTFKETYGLRMRLAELMGELSPVEFTREHLAQIDDLIARSKKLTKTRSSEEFAMITNDLQKILSSLTGNAPLREIIELFYFRVARIWFTFLPQLGWDDMVAGQLAELKEIRAAMECNDIRGVGQSRSLHLHRMLTRISRFLIEP